MKTVFVIGAGASNEVDLPVGAELKGRIAHSLRQPSKGGAHRIWEALNFLHHRGTLGVDYSQLYPITEGIQHAMPLAPSIDHYLDAHSEEKTIITCSKLAIVHAILEAESKSKLFVDPLKNARLDFAGVEKTWFSKFMQLLTKGPRANLKDRLSSIVLIIFNYDRCVEHCIFHALQTYYYGMSKNEAAELLKGIEIYHPYGSVGSLPCLGGDKPVEFGVPPHASELPGLAERIKTFTEGTDKESSDIVAIRRHMESALRLVFLGFAFDDMNMDLLDPNPDVKTRHTFATCYRLSISMREKVSARFGSNDELNNPVLFFDTANVRNYLPNIHMISFSSNNPRLLS